MIESIITFCLQVLIPLIGRLLDKIDADVQSKQSYIDFITTLSKKENISVKLHKSFQDQFEKLKNL